MSRLPIPTAVAVALLIAANGARANDARAIALGGSNIADGHGVPGALANPAALMAMGRRGERLHFRFGLSGELRDDAQLIDIATDEANETLASDTEDAIAAIDASRVGCLDVNAIDQTVCVSGLAPVARLTERALDVLDRIDGESVTARLGGDAGFAVTAGTTPFALHVQARVIGRARVDVADADRAYLNGFTSTLADGVLTLGEIRDTAQFTLDEVNQRLEVRQPEDALVSSSQGGGVARLILGASLARTVNIGGRAVDVGLTPKFSAYVTRGIEARVGDEFDENNPTLQRQLENSEVTGTSFTVDIGASVALEERPLRLAAVVRHALPESIETGDGVEFHTTPQLVVGGAWRREGSSLTVSADLALNEAEIDGFPTQVLALGAELVRGPLALRGGINHDAARAVSPTALSLGLGLGPFDLGVRVSSVENIQAGVQLSLGFGGPSGAVVVPREETPAAPEAPSPDEERPKGG